MCCVHVAAESGWEYYQNVPGGKNIFSYFELKLISSSVSYFDFEVACQLAGGFHWFK